MQRRFGFKPSFLLAFLLVVAHGAALFAVSVLAVFWAQLALFVLLSFNLFYLLWSVALLRSPASCVGLVFEPDRVVLMQRNGTAVRAQLLGDSLVMPWLTVLNLKPEGVRWARRVVILPDSLDAESFRELRVWLRWGGQPLL
ncbi:MAG: hypothetical protein HY849_02765 [Nitrosomonadales bacterium]|nr:hypothetical protein [Nitrosomonadales bacterium]